MATSINIQDAARWLARLAASDGAVRLRHRSVRCGLAYISLYIQNLST